MKIMYTQEKRYSLTLVCQLVRFNHYDCLKRNVVRMFIVIIQDLYIYE